VFGDLQDAVDEIGDPTSSKEIEGRVLRRWQPPSLGVRPAEKNHEELQQLIQTLPPPLTQSLQTQFGDRWTELNEIFAQLGQVPEAIFCAANGQTQREQIGGSACTDEDIGIFSAMFEANEHGTTSSKRIGIPGTLHRVSLITHPMRIPEKVLGVAVRVGRAMDGLVATMLGPDFLVELATKKHSLLLIGKPGVGKTTVLREIAKLLANYRHLNVVVVDKTCEIAGDGDTPHGAIGRARWMPVGKPDMQHQIMREAVENQSPDVIIVDEISSQQEVEAARTIAQRGVALIATVHGTTLPELINCRERGHLVGGASTVTLSGAEADKRYDKRKQVQKRAREPVFGCALELHSRDSWIFHPSVREAVDEYFEGEPCDAERLTPGLACAVTAIPDEGVFEYCVQCGLGPTCSQHADGQGQGQGQGATQSTRPTSASASSFTSEPPPRSFQGRPPSQTARRPAAAAACMQNSDTSGFSFSTAGARRPPRRRRGGQRNGRCFSCGEQGHFSRDCASR
jgi:stage III sporulation protein SpoIIIAA